MTKTLTAAQKAYLQSLTKGDRMLTAKTDRTTKILESEGLIECYVGDSGFSMARLTVAGKAFTISDVKRAILLLSNMTFSELQTVRKAMGWL